MCCSQSLAMDLAHCNVYNNVMCVVASDWQWTCSHRWVTRYTTANVWFILGQTKPHGKTMLFFGVFFKLWRNVHGVYVIRTHATQTKTHNILPRSNNSFRSSFARPSLLPCKLSPRSYWTRPPRTDIFQVDRLETISFVFVFLISALRF